MCNKAELEKEARKERTSRTKTKNKKEIRDLLLLISNYLCFDILLLVLISIYLCIKKPLLRFKAFAPTNEHSSSQILITNSPDLLTV